MPYICNNNKQKKQIMEKNAKNEKNVDFENPIVETKEKKEKKVVNWKKVAGYGAAGLGLFAGGYFIGDCIGNKKGFKNGFSTGAAAQAIADRVKPGMEEAAEQETGIPVRRLKEAGANLQRSLRDSGKRWI